MISLSYPLSSLLTNKKISRFNFLGERKRANERERERGGQKKDYERGRKRVPFFSILHFKIFKINL